MSHVCLQKKLCKVWSKFIHKCGRYEAEIILGQTDGCGDSYTAINFVYRGIITDRLHMYIKQWSRFHGNI